MAARSWIWRSGGTKLSLSHLYDPHEGHAPRSDPCSVQTCSATLSLGLRPSLSTSTFLSVTAVQARISYLPQRYDLILTDGHVAHLALIILQSSEPTDAETPPLRGFSPCLKSWCVCSLTPELQASSQLAPPADAEQTASRPEGAGMRSFLCL